MSALAAEAALTEDDLAAGLYVARRDLEDMRLMRPDLDTCVTLTEVTTAPSRPRTIAEFDAGVTVPMVTTVSPVDRVKPTELHEWRGPQIDALGLSRATDQWWEAYLARFYPELTLDTQVTVFRGLTKPVGETIFDVPDTGLHDIGCYWTLNPLVAQEFAYHGPDKTGGGQVAVMKLTLREAVAAAGKGNGMTATQNLAFGTGVDRVFPQEMAIVLDYRELPEHVKETARVVHADAVAPAGREHDRALREHVSYRGGAPRRLMHVLGFGPEEGALDDALARLGSAVRLADAGRGSHPERVAALEAAVDEATLDLAVARRAFASGSSIAAEATAVPVAVEAVNAQPAAVAQVLGHLGVHVDELRAVLVKDEAGVSGVVDLAAYRRVRRAVRQAVDQVGLLAGVVVVAGADGLPWQDPGLEGAEGFEAAYAAASPELRAEFRDLLTSPGGDADAALGRLLGRRPVRVSRYAGGATRTREAVGVGAGA